MKRVNLKPVKDFAVKTCKVIGSGIVIAIPYVVSEVVCKNYNPNSITYYDAVEAITNSFMPSSCQREAIALLKRSETEDYYKSVIAVVNSFMCSSEQVETIRQLSGEV